MNDMHTERETFDIKMAYEHLMGYAVKAHVAQGRRIARVLCPVHSERRPSCDLDLDKNLWHCHSVCKAGGDAVEMVIRNGCLGTRSSTRETYRAAFEWLRALTGTRPNLLPQPAVGTNNNRVLKEVYNSIVFPYRDRTGELAYEVVRLEGLNFDNEPDKDFLTRRPLPAGDWHLIGDKYVYCDPMGRPVPWGPNDANAISRDRYNRNGTARRKPVKNFVYSLRGVERHLYHLDMVRRCAQTRGRLHLVEGEKKDDRLIDRTGWTVTTFASGVNAELNPNWLEDIDGVDELVIWCDSEAVGRLAATQRAQFFGQRIRKVRIVNLYFDDSHRDVNDFMSEHRALSAPDFTALLEERIQRTALVKG